MGDFIHWQYFVLYIVGPEIYRSSLKPLVCKLFYYLPAKKNRICFSNFAGKGYGDNPKYVADEEFLDSLTDTLNEIKNDDRLGIEEIYSNEEARDMGADECCFCMIEGKRGYYFLNEFDILTEKVSETKNHKMLAIHGCLNTKDENKTFFVASGKGIKKGVTIDSMRLWDEGPTIAKMMGGHLPAVDGEIITGILE